MYNYFYRISIFFVTIYLLTNGFTVPSAARAQTLDVGLEDLSKQISNGMSEKQKRKIAVIEFSDLDGKSTEFGKFLSEELITRLFLTRKCDVVERQLLNKVLQEHKLNLSGIIDQSSAKKLGNLLGVDSICSGTVADLIDGIKINARVISTETGAVFAVASTQIKKDEIVNKLMGKVSYANTSDGTNKVAMPGHVVFLEDFGKVQEGQIPQGWVGGETIAVKKSGRFKNRNVLVPFKAGTHAFTIPNIDFPDNFKLEIEMIYNDSCCEAMMYNVGNLTFGLHTNGGSWLDDSKFRITNDTGKVNQINYVPYDEVILITLEKNGTVFKLYVNGKQLSMIRKTNFDKGTSFAFSYKKMFGIYKIAILSL